MEVLPSEILCYLIEVVADRLLHEEQCYPLEVEGPLPKRLHLLEKERRFRATRSMNPVVPRVHLHRFELDCGWAAINALACTNRTFARAWKAKKDEISTRGWYCDMCCERLEDQFVTERATEYNTVFGTSCNRFVHNNDIDWYNCICEYCQLDLDLLRAQAGRALVREALARR
jgi:hypothetical protein